MRKRIVRWPEGKPWLWELVEIEMKEERKQHPVWYDRAKRLKAAGYSYRAISKTVKVSVNTVRRQLQNPHT